MNAWRKLNLAILVAALTLLGLVVGSYRLLNPPPRYPEITALEAARTPARFMDVRIVELHKAFPMLDEATLLRIALIDDPGERHEALKAAQQALEAEQGLGSDFSLLPDAPPEARGETRGAGPIFGPGLPPGTGAARGKPVDPFTTACGTVEECDPYPEEDPLAGPLYDPLPGEPAAAADEPEA